MSIESTELGNYQYAAAPEIPVAEDSVGALFGETLESTESVVLWDVAVASAFEQRRTLSGMDGHDNLFIYTSLAAMRNEHIDSPKQQKAPKEVFVFNAGHKRELEFLLWRYNVALDGQQIITVEATKNDLAAVTHTEIRSWLARDTTGTLQQEIIKVIISEVRTVDTPIRGNYHTLNRLLKEIEREDREEEKEQLQKRRDELANTISRQEMLRLWVYTSAVDLLVYNGGLGPWEIQNEKLHAEFQAVKRYVEEKRKKPSEIIIFSKENDTFQPAA